MVELQTTCSTNWMAAVLRSNWASRLHDRTSAKPAWNSASPRMNFPWAAGNRATSTAPKKGTHRIRLSMCMSISPLRNGGVARRHPDT